MNKKSVERQGQTHFHLAHYADGLFRSYEERLTSSEWHAATRLRKHKVTQSTLEMVAETILYKWVSSRMMLSIDPADNGIGSTY